MERQGNGQAATARAEIKRGRRCRRPGREVFPSPLRQGLRFGSRHQNVSIDPDFQPAEGGGPGDLLQRFMLSPSLDPAPEGIQFALRQFPLKIEVELEPREFQQLREEQFHLQPRRLDRLAREIGCAALDDFQNRHGSRLGDPGREQSQIRARGPDLTRPDRFATVPTPR